MQFSTSATLAALAIFAGQTLAAQCVVGAPPKTGSGALGACRSTGSGDSKWSCAQGTTVTKTGDTRFLVHAGGKSTTIKILCDGQVGLVLTCPAGASGTANVPCGGHYAVQSSN
ncbi:hypothetical protein E4U54_002525 [Claviceps lovelessii]|nr:hypothetical protein E4U54_002525 [Claviceps lovelessii]